ncbi:MAG TPA: tRNA pseudouridine(55) synthase TruB [Chlamydiales bacterium]|nr:tRNA pseudouridine(55) synthase TruB [Chlamydiales bacterium]
MKMETSTVEGVLLINKTPGKTSFSIISELRRKLNVKKIGHAGTLDPFASGVMVLLVGKKYTTLSNQFMGCDKEYWAELKLGYQTESFDPETPEILISNAIPSEMQINEVLKQFQGEIEQIPPMYSAKKINGKKLYQLARKGQTVERPAQKIKVQIELIDYSYPNLELKITCSKGTYIRSLAHDIGNSLGVGAYLQKLTRLRSGSFHLKDCLDQDLIFSSQFTPDLLIKNESLSHA